ncbi:MAG TPA: hypothetical protein VIR56_16905, partial [Solimonas sp.]
MTDSGGVADAATPVLGICPIVHFALSRNGQSLPRQINHVAVHRQILNLEMGIPIRDVRRKTSLRRSTVMRTTRT